MMMKYNLIDEPWIPVTLKDGTSKKVSLLEIFDPNANISDLNVGPLERIALLRLFLCIAQAAINGPMDEEDRKCAREKIISAIPAYLEKWHSKFFLWTETNQDAFLQPRGIITDSPKDLSSIDLYRPSGARTVLLNNDAFLEPLSDGEIALRLLVFMNFATCGTLGCAKWRGLDTSLTPQGSSGDAPCTAQNALHAFVIKDNVLDTICANLVDKASLADGRALDKQLFGRPYWHDEIVSQHEPQEAVLNATTSFLGRLVPISRAVKLKRDLRSVEVALGDGLKYPIAREFTCTIFREKKKIKILQAHEEEAVWRSLTAILMKRDDIGTRQPFALTFQRGHAFKLWVGGVQTKKEKIIESIESEFLIPEIDGDIRFSNALAMYEKLVDVSNYLIINIDKAAKKYAEVCHTKHNFSSTAKRIYWTILDGNQSILMRLFGNESFDDVAEAWHRLCRTAAIDALRAACPHMTARQIRAFAAAKAIILKQKKTKKK